MRHIVWMMAMAVGLLMTQVAAANCGDGACPCCDDCGCDYVCTLECVEEEITVNCYGVECDTICIPRHAKAGCKHCEAVCKDCEDKDCCECSWDPLCIVKWRKWCPTCAKPKDVKKLVKYEVTKKVPAYKWVYKKACNCGCGDGCASGCCDVGGSAGYDEAPAPADPAPAAGQPSFPPVPTAGLPTRQARPVSHRLAPSNSPSIFTK